MSAVTARCCGRSRCGACKMPCAGCNTRADRGTTRGRCRCLRPLDDPTRANGRSRSSRPFLTGYDMNHLVTYLRLLDADPDHADWQEVARIVLSLDVDSEPPRAKRVWESNLSRAKWMTTNGYRHLLRGGASQPAKCAKRVRQCSPALGHPRWTLQTEKLLLAPADVLTEHHTISTGSERHSLITRPTLVDHATEKPPSPSIARFWSQHRLRID